MEHARKGYPSDLRDAEWVILEPLIRRQARWTPRTPQSARDHQRHHLCGARGQSAAISGNQWRAMPHDLPPWQTACYYFRLWRHDGTWERIHTALRERSRRRVGRAATRGDARRRHPR